MASNSQSMAEPEVYESDGIQNKIYRNIELYQVVCNGISSLQKTT